MSLNHAWDNYRYRVWYVWMEDIDGGHMLHIVVVDLDGHYKGVVSFSAKSTLRSSSWSRTRRR